MGSGGTRGKARDQSYDAAVSQRRLRRCQVVLEADPGKVYDKTIERLKTHPEVTITKEDKQTGTIEIQKGKQVAGFQINALGEKVTQMIVASGVRKSKESDQTSVVIDSIMRVCAEFNVKCTVQPH
jgi:hypothetical protein